MNNGLRRRYNNCGLFETPRGMSCGITAVCAITGNSPDEIITVGFIGSRDTETRFRDQLRTIEALGCALRDHNHTAFQANDFPIDRCWTESRIE